MSFKEWSQAQTARSKADAENKPKGETPAAKPAGEPAKPAPAPAVKS